MNLNNNVNKEELANKGLRKTKARDAVLTELKKCDYPISAEYLYKKLRNKSFNLSTIYRSLNAFENKGIIKREVNANKENVYSLIKEEDSHVLVCVKCSKRVPLDGCPYHEANHQIEDKTGFALLDHNTEIYGICPECQKEK